jgi:hypothetical protein
MKHPYIVLVTVLAVLASMNIIIYYALHSPQPWAVVMAIAYFGSLILFITFARKAART